MYASIITDEISNDLSKALSVIRKEGYQYIELHQIGTETIEELTETEAREVKKIIDHYGMQVTCLSSTVFFLCPLYEDNEVTLFNPSFHAVRGDVNAHLRYLKQACLTAHLLGCPAIRIFPFRWPDNKKPPFGTEEDRDRIAAYVRKAVDIAESQSPRP
jgi:sugar phosphate isomerase/epimerase